jgi:hypothetical protein
MALDTIRIHIIGKIIRDTTNLPAIDAAIGT